MRKAMNRSAMVSVVVVASLLGAACMVGDEEDGAEGDVEVEVEDERSAAPDEETLEREVAEAGGVGSVTTGTEAARAVATGTEAKGTEAKGTRITCPAGLFCLWQHSDKLGDMFFTNDGRCTDLVPWGFNDLASSWRNRTTRNFRVYEHAGCRGRYFTARSGGHADRLAGWDDRASSVCSGAGCP